MNAPSSTRSNKNKFKAALNRSLNERSKAMAVSVQPTQGNISQTQDSQPPLKPAITATAYWNVWHWMQRRLSLSAPRKLMNLSRQISKFARKTHHLTEEINLTRSSYPE